MGPCAAPSGPTTSGGLPLSQPKPMIDVVIIGAGPGGLLLALYLLEKGSGRFKVSIHEAREDPRETIKQPPSPRRSPLGIWRRGLAALQGIDGLWPRVNTVGAPASVCKVWVLGRFLSVPHRAEDNPQTLTDRCALCATMLELLLARYGGSGLLDITFNQRCTSVDLKIRSVTFSASTTSACRNSGGLTEADQVLDVGERNPNQGITMRYDLIVGADGVRSVVRQGIVQSTRRFDYEQRDIGWEWLVTRIPVPPPPVKDDWGVIILGKPFALLVPGCPTLNGDSEMNLVLGWMAHEKPPEWHACITAEEAKAYLDRAYPWLNTPLESAEALLPVNQRVNTSTQLKCSVYHEAEGSAVLIGDAAHATNPILGQGCNTALEDAATLASLLLETNTISELPDALESYSALRVPEGHALVDVAESQGPMDWWGVVRNILNMIWQTLLNRLFPTVFPPHILVSVSSGKPLSEIYKANKGFVDSVLGSNRCAIRRVTEKRNQERKDSVLARLKSAPAGS